MTLRSMCKFLYAVYFDYFLLANRQVSWAHLYISIVCTPSITQLFSLVDIFSCRTVLRYGEDTSITVTCIVLDNIACSKICY
uniref:Uncharacterized protein n=1 Tax=Arundo donax TaxID=35708 RepID=A0A0A9G2F5_ARUDO